MSEICVRSQIDEWMRNNTVRVPSDDVIWDMVVEQCTEIDTYNNDDGEWLVGYPEKLDDDNDAWNGFLDGKNYAEGVVKDYIEEVGRAYYDIHN